MDSCRASRLTILATGLVTLCLLAPAAMGATVGSVTDGTADGTAIFRAASGEANQLLIGNWYSWSCQLPGLCVSDSGAPLSARSGCEAADAHTAGCAEVNDIFTTTRHVRVLLGDRDDSAIEESYRRKVALFGGDGNDVVASGSTEGKSPALYGGVGDDSLYVNNNGAGTPVLHGGDGDDRLRPLCGGSWFCGHAYGGAGDDVIAANQLFPLDGLHLAGGPGNDTYRFSAIHYPDVIADSIEPGPGFDTLDASRSRTDVLVDLRGCAGCVERILGGADQDHINGRGGDQVILGGADPDDLTGGRGVDRLGGGTGDDLIRSRDGEADLVTCGRGIDLVVADDADDVRGSCELVRR
jgi:Ca2+-binding RTX toxin-like protein